MYIISLRVFLFSAFEIEKNGFVNWHFFKKNVFPYVLKIDTEYFFEFLELFKIGYENIFSLKSEKKIEITEKELLEKLQEYQLSKELSMSLFQLFCNTWFYVSSKLDFTVVCNLGLRSSVRMEIGNFYSVLPKITFEYMKDLNKYDKKKLLEIFFNKEKE